MRVLYLTNKPIYPLVDGGCKAMESFLNCLLENKWEVTHICISTEKHPFSIDNYPKDLQQKIKIKSIFISTKVSFKNAFNALLKGESYTISRFKSVEFSFEIKQTLANNKFDLAILESLYATGNIKELIEQEDLKILLRTHNVEHKLWGDKAVKCINPLKKMYLNLLAKQLKKYEIETLRKVDGILTISELDEKEFQQLDTYQSIITIPVALPFIQKRSDYSSTSFFFIGSMNWQPNIEAVNLLLETIFPLIQKEIPDAKLVLAGSFMTPQLKNHRQKGVEILGFVPDLERFFNENGIMLSPIQTGSGVRVKLLEAMNSGIPIVSSLKGAEGININGQLIVEDNAQEFAKKAVKLYSNINFRAELGSKSYEFAQNNYSTITIAKTIREFVDTL